jgi:ribose transport system permease protein
VKTFADFARRNGSSISAYALALFLFTVAVIYSSGFASSANITILLTSATIFAVPALGMTFVVLAGGIDLSIPWLITAGALLTTQYARDTDLPVVVVAAAVVAAGGLVGLVNGIGVTVFAISPIVMTLATGGLVSGYVLAPSVTAAGSGAAPRALTGLLEASVGPIPWVTILLLVVAIAVGTVLSRGRLGYQIYATGTNDVVATLAGVPVRRVRVTTYVISGGSSAAAGILLLGYTGQAYTTMGQPYLFASIAAVAIGGVALGGGAGNYWGAIGGALVLTVLSVILPLFQLGFGQMQILYGAVVLLGIGMARVLDKPDRQSRSQSGGADRPPPASSSSAPQKTADR